MCIRNTIDIEFTNFGQHYRFPFIPEREVWIDKEHAPDELEFFIVHLVTEQRLMAGGASYEDALDAADGRERELRTRAGGAVASSGRGQQQAMHNLRASLWDELDAGVKVWVVDGRLVRSVFDIDFTEGGHDLVYDYVPPREIWIDNDLDERERPFVLFHELHERNLMAKGWGYEPAHAEASGREFHLRRHPDELHAALADEGWSSNLGIHVADESRGNKTDGR
jgi:hypothetical protein